MKRLRPFILHQPSSVREAVELLGAGAGEPRVLAGGTDLLVDMKLVRVRPTAVINLKRIDGLDRIEHVEGGIRIGSLARVSALESSPLVRARCGALWQASRVLASRPVRNLATIGGNLGRASPASDLAPPLIVHGATIQVEGLEGKRPVPIEQFHVGPGVSCLAPHEIITSVFLPDSPARTGSAYRKLGKRGGGSDIALVGVAVSVLLDDGGRVADARIALASVAPTPLRARAAEDGLRGRMPSEESLAAAAEAAAEETRPISDVRASSSYRKSLARVLTLRTLRDALSLAQQEPSPR